MILPVVKYGHPALRQKGARIDTITPEIAQLVSDMFETMHDAHGLGLASQQVGRPLQLTVLDVRGVQNRPSTLFVNGQPAEVDAFMPLVLINPEIRPVAHPVEGSEGCLSFPEIYAEISRPEVVEVAALNPQGEPLAFRCGGLLARAIQHEKDHLQGILFIDRMSREVRAQLQPQLAALQAATKAALKEK
jgi:peptide deformylase